MGEIDDDDDDLLRRPPRGKDTDIAKPDSSPPWGRLGGGFYC